MLALLAAATMTATVAAAPTADLRARVLVEGAPPMQACKTNGRFEIADPALLYRDNGKAKMSALSRLPKANHEKAVLREIDGCAAPLVVGYEVGR
ncbi:MAG: hypothetical protein JHD15_18805 [Phenylobacterium sp.]|uniref:hypothetical protein n=1 Tax=Phenylobacterium sp. TaxID=1871053 RepID=UPI001A2A6B98|nr:hypothetical protein [Phenylobacterium sp.]MBJ7412389.1 hypothetical protein [Phenylobacterium sp.]